MDFFTRQLIDAAAPSNFAATNPEVIKLAAASNGESLRRGLELLGDDQRKNRITQCDEAAFEVGRNIAVTPGAVVFENELMQLIQYRPQTASVHARPLVMVPPCINKYYILDLQPENSFVRFAVTKGYTVFMVSWVNPDTEHARCTFDDYMKSGPLAALDAIERATGEKSVNAIGFCLGGTLLASTLGYLAAKKDKRIASATFLATMIDFARPSVSHGIRRSPVASARCCQISSVTNGMIGCRSRRIVSRPRSNIDCACFRVAGSASRDLQSSR